MNVPVRFVKDHGHMRFYRPIMLVKVENGWPVHHLGPMRAKWFGVRVPMLFALWWVS